jgi:nitric oxide reductase NorQ protein
LSRGRDAVDTRIASPLAAPPAAAPHYQPAGQEVALFEAAWAQRLPLLLKGPAGW